MSYAQTETADINHVVKTLQGKVLDLLGLFIGTILGYGSIGFAIFAIAFVLAKSLKKTWPYKVALILTVIVYSALIAGYIYASKASY
jgi:NhaP-type Na+/H+ or K+/H+ antiporter